MPSELADRLRHLLGPVVADQGLVLEDVTVSPAGKRTVVRAVVDLPDGPGGVTSDQLADASRAVSAALDDADPIGGAYTLEVSTPGAERPLTSPRHFRRAVGRTVEVTTAQGTSVGRLTDVVDDAAVVGGTTYRLADVTRARVVVRLNEKD